MTSRERVLCALSLGRPDVVPFAEQFVGSPLPQRLLGLPDEADYEPRTLAERMGNDVVKFSRLPPLYYERVPMRGGGTGIGPGLIRTRDDLRRLAIPDDDDWIANAKEFLRTQRGDRAAAGGTRLGLSPTLISMGLDSFSIALYEDRGLVEEVMDRYVAFAERTVQVFCELGFDLVWCFDDFACRSGPMFSPAVFRDLVAPRLKRATDRISVPWIFHSDGNLFPVLDDLLSLGMNGLHPIEPESMDLAEAKRALQGRACVIGNVSVDLLARGTPEQVHAAVEDCFAAGAPHGGYMISSGNSIPAYAKQENVEAMIRAVAELRDRY